jgi:hypothetical protein
MTQGRVGGTVVGGAGLCFAALGADKREYLLLCFNQRAAIIIGPDIARPASTFPKDSAALREGGDRTAPGDRHRP